MAYAVVASPATDLLELVFAGPATGAGIALLGVYVAQRMQRKTQADSRHRDEVRTLAAELLALAEALWRRGWELHNATAPMTAAIESAGPDSPLVHDLTRKHVDAMLRENETHEEILSTQFRLMLTSPALDGVAAELVDASRLWPPAIERPAGDRYSRREEAERAFVAAARNEIGTTASRASGGRR